MPKIQQYPRLWPSDLRDCVHKMCTTSASKKPCCALHEMIFIAETAKARYKAMKVIPEVTRAQRVQEILKAKHAQEVLKAKQEVVVRNKNGESRAVQTGLFAQEVPYEILVQIFDNLGPATQRILGATCITLYTIFKEKYSSAQKFLDLLPPSLPPDRMVTIEYIANASIFVHVHLDMNIGHWSDEYAEIMQGWIMYLGLDLRIPKHRKQFIEEEFGEDGCVRRDFRDYNQEHQNEVLRWWNTAILF